MNIKRFDETKEHLCTIGRATTDDPNLIVCPKCRAKGLVIPFNSSVKAVCTKCTYTTIKSSHIWGFPWNGFDPRDRYFGYELWLKADCNGHTLWAFNIRHLNFLEAYVSARLRERSKDEQTIYRNSLLASRLPRWLKASKNRNSVIKVINKLKQKIQ